jgi:hypothetical protein
MRTSSPPTAQAARLKTNHAAVARLWTILSRPRSAIAAHPRGAFRGGDSWEDNKDNKNHKDSKNILREGGGGVWLAIHECLRAA